MGTMLCIVVFFSHHLQVRLGALPLALAFPSTFHSAENRHGIGFLRSLVPVPIRDL
jgi:hypothetical protein